jgi:hypothetical protein
VWNGQNIHPHIEFVSCHYVWNERDIRVCNLLAATVCEMNRISAREICRRLPLRVKWTEYPSAYRICQLPPCATNDPYPWLCSARFCPGGTQFPWHPSSPGGYCDCWTIRKMAHKRVWTSLTRRKKQPLTLSVGSHCELKDLIMISLFFFWIQLRKGWQRPLCLSLALKLDRVRDYYRCIALFLSCCRISQVSQHNVEHSCCRSWFFRVLGETVFN